MSNLSPNKTDKFFRQALKTAPELSPTEKHWNDMERLLIGKPNKRTVGWFYWPLGIAAGLLIFLSVWFSREPETRLADGGKIESSKVEKQNKENRFPNTEDGSTIPQASLPDPLIPTEAKTSGLNEVFVQQESKKQFENLIGTTINSTINRTINSEAKTLFQPFNIALFQGLRNINTLTSNDFSAIKAVSLKAVKSPAIDSNSKGSKSNIENPNGRFSLSMAFTTDMNTVNALSNSKSGLSYGIGMNYRITKFLSAGTGIYYSQKKYTSDKYSYNTTEKPFSTWASYSKQIDASCNVIDIPLNLNVMLSKTQKMGIVASAGLSSYIMLSEKYNFIYNPSPYYSSNGREYTIKNKNEHILSVVNLSVGIEKPVGKQSSIVIQPYAKLPMSGIGQGQTDLKSFGIGFQLNYSMKKKNKFFNRESE